MACIYKLTISSLELNECECACEKEEALAIQYLKKVVNNLIVNDCENKCLNFFLLFKR